MLWKPNTGMATSSVAERRVVYPSTNSLDWDVFAAPSNYYPQIPLGFVRSNGDFLAAAICGTRGLFA